jgi:hypothetical protein
MNRTEFEGMCELFGDGQLIWVENQNSHVKGRVIGCEADKIEVKVGDHNEKWNRSECGEMTHGFKVKYDEVKKHPHEYDTHLD